MNESNSITPQTALFGFIAESAQSNRFSVTLNRMFKEHQDNAMMIPMNIREDDLYFTLSNMRRSHLKGAYIAPEYRHALPELLDTLEDKRAFYDFVWIRDEQLMAQNVLPHAISSYMMHLGVTRIAIIGSGALAAALEKVLVGLHVSYFDPHIEALMQLSQYLGKEIDINRLAQGMQVDLSGYDIVIDTSKMKDFSMITALAPYVLQLENENTNLAQMADTYIDYAAFLPHLCEETYTMIHKEIVP